MESHEPRTLVSLPGLTLHDAFPTSESGLIFIFVTDPLINKLPSQMQRWASGEVSHSCGMLREKIQKQNTNRDQERKSYNTTSCQRKLHPDCAADESVQRQSSHSVDCSSKQLTRWLALLLSCDHTVYLHVYIYMITALKHSCATSLGYELKLANRLGKTSS